MQTYLKWGDWNSCCQVCGFRYKASQLKRRWDGLYVCKQDWELRHEQDLIKIPKEDQSVPFTIPEPPDVFITVNYVDASVGVQENVVPASTSVVLTDLDTETDDPILIDPDLGSLTPGILV